MKKRFIAGIEPQKKTKDFAYTITDRRTKEVLTFGGYKDARSAKRGFNRAISSKGLLNGNNIETNW